MTFEEILKSDKPMLRPQDVAKVLGCHPQAINVLARTGRLPFPFIRSGNRTKIPREAFIAWMRGGKEMKPWA